MTFRKEKWFTFISFHTKKTHCRFKHFILNQLFSPTSSIKTIPTTQNGGTCIHWEMHKRCSNTLGNTDIQIIKFLKKISNKSMIHLPLHSVWQPTRCNQNFESQTFEKLRTKDLESQSWGYTGNTPGINLLSFLSLNRRRDKTLKQAGTIHTVRYEKEELTQSRRTWGTGLLFLPPPATQRIRCSHQRGRPRAGLSEHPETPATAHCRGPRPPLGTHTYGRWGRPSPGSTHTEHSPLSQVGFLVPEWENDTGTFSISHFPLN